MLALVDLLLNIKGHSVTLIPPPGGTVFTAILTDLEILSRYLFNLLAPVALSAVYFVDPIRSVTDPRAAGYGILLATIIVLTIKLARNRRRATISWQFFISSVGPNLNLIALPHIMQDRYVYLATPWLILVLVEVFAGLRESLQRRGKLNFAWPLGTIGACAYVTLFAVLALERGGVWISSRSIFEDAVRKQPRAGFARFALGSTYRDIGKIYLDLASKMSSGVEQNADRAALTKAGAEAYQIMGLQQWQYGLDQCPDLHRFNIYLNMAWEVGEEFYRQGRVDSAEKYWRMAAAKPTETIDDRVTRAIANGSLCTLCLFQKRYIDALDFVNVALKLSSEESLRLLHAQTVLALAQEMRKSGDKLDRANLITAREELLSIPPSSEARYRQAQEYLRSELLNPDSSL
jgi:tetratricopeptide (TPR) repeat protein